MSEKTELQRMMVHREDREAGWYEHPEMLVRLAQLSIMTSRGITETEVAEELGTSKQIVNLYFKGRNPRWGRGPKAEASVEEIDVLNDQVERALEKIIERKERVQATVDPDEALRFRTALTEYYMHSDHKPWRLRG